MPPFSALPLLTALLLIPAAGAGPAMHGASLVRDACGRIEPADLQSLCISSLSGEPPSAAADLHQLAIIAVRIAADNASQIASFFASRQAASDSVLAQCAVDCADLYVDVVEQLDTATAAIDDGAVDDAMTWLEAAADDVRSCHEGCAAAAPGGSKNAVAAEKLLKIATSLAKQLKKQKGL